MSARNMVVTATDPHDDDEQNNENTIEMNEEFQDDSDAEYASLNAQLDQLNSVLDTLEMKNDVIHAEFVELLKSNRETRQQIQESINNDTKPSEKSGLQ